MGSFYFIIIATDWRCLSSVLLLKTIFSAWHEHRHTHMCARFRSTLFAWTLSWIKTFFFWFCFVYFIEPMERLRYKRGQTTLDVGKSSAKMVHDAFVVLVTVFVDHNMMKTEESTKKRNEMRWNPQCLHVSQPCESSRIANKRCFFYSPVISCFGKFAYTNNDQSIWLSFHRFLVFIDVGFFLASSS